MLGEALTLTILGLVLALGAQEDHRRTIAAAVFVLPVVAHDLFAEELDGWWYYGSAAALDLLVVYTLGKMRPVTQLAQGLQVISLAAICVNLVGWVGWRLYWPPIGYNLAFLGLYGWAIIVLLTKERTDVGLGDRTVDRRGPGLCSLHRPCSLFNHRHEGGK